MLNICFFFFFFFFFKQKTAYEMLLCDWSSDVCSSDLRRSRRRARNRDQGQPALSGRSSRRSRNPTGGHRHLVPAASAARGAELQEIGGARRQEGLKDTHSALAPESLTTFAHFVISCRTYRAN